ncbi:MAG: carbonic anhydrase family protein [Vicinamibacterales bacterium]
MYTQTKDTLLQLTPRKAFEILAEGNRRFVSNLRYNRNLLQQVNDTSDGQHPFAIVLSCIDSRTSAELIFDQGLGDIFSVRVAGNVLNDDILGSMEFACQLAGAKLVVVLGHTRCGAIKGACHGVRLGHLSGLLDKVGPAIREVAEVEGPLDPEAQVERVAVANTRVQMRSILDRSPILATLVDEGRIGLVGGVYSVESGEVTFFEPHFTEMPEAVAVQATA